MDSFNIAFSTTLTYITRNYKPEDVDRFMQKLDLTIEDLSRAYPVVKQSQQYTKSHPGQSGLFTSKIHDALCGDCTSPELATQLVPRLSRDAVIAMSTTFAYDEKLQSTFHTYIYILPTKNYIDAQQAVYYIEFARCQGLPPKDILRKCETTSEIVYIQQLNEEFSTLDLGTGSFI